MSNELTPVALVGSETLMGREVRDLVSTAGLPFDLRLIETGAPPVPDPEAEPATPVPLRAASLSGARAVVLAGPPEANRKAIHLVDGEAALIDLAFTAEDRPDARLRAPFVEADAEVPAGENAIHVIAHPAAIALAMFLRRLQAHDAIRRSVVQIFVPASEHGAAGVEELQQQTISLLSFKNLPRKVFDTQASFNLLARYGPDALAALEKTELRIERHLATLLALSGEGDGVPMPSLRVIQAPVFHGYGFSAWVEFEENPGVEALESGLATPHIEVRGPEVEAPTTVGQAGQRGIAVGAISEDRNHADACWFWLVADNLRLAAENAVAVAEELL